MPKLMVVTTVCPYPKNVGKFVIWGGVLDYLRSRADIELTICSFAPFEADFPCRVVLLSRPRIKEIIFSLLFDVFIKKNRSIQEAFFYSKFNVGVLKKVLASSPQDTVLYDTVRTQQYDAHFAGLRKSSITYLDDLFSVRYERVLNAVDNGMDADKHVLGNFADKLPAFAKKIFDRSPRLRSFILRTEMRAIKRSEHRACMGSDISLLINPAEVLEARKQCPQACVEEIAPRMEMRDSSMRTWDGAPLIVFLGSLKLSHNIIGIEWFLEMCFPELLKKMPDMRLNIIGAGSSERLDSLIARYPGNAEKLGFVDDIDAHLASACCMISPLLFGSGIKIKIIDALRTGLPVVSTLVGAEGIHGQKSGAIRIADLSGDFVSEIIELSDPSKNQTASAAAFSEFRNHYAASSTQRSYDRIFGNANF